MKQYLGKIAVVAVALVAVLSCQSEAAVLSVQAHHGGANVHRVVKVKHQQRKMKAAKSQRVCHHRAALHHGRKHCCHVGCKARRYVRYRCH